MVAVFLGLKKAFDTVNNEILLGKLKKIHFSDETIAWFHTHLKHREQWVGSKGYHLTLNYKKTVSMCFSIKIKADENSRVKIDEIEISQVAEFISVGVILDSELKFNRHVKKLCKTVKSNLNCFHLIRQYIPLKAAQQFLHAMIFSRLSYCITVWGQANQSTMIPMDQKIMDQEPARWHHCQILKKTQFTGF